MSCRGARRINLTPYPAQFYNPFVKGIHCQRCNRQRNEMVCPHCGYVFVHIMFQYQNESFDIYHDRFGQSYTYSQAELDKREIDNQRKTKTLRPEDWRPKEREARKFQTMFGTFLDKKTKLHPSTKKLYSVYYRNHFTGLYDYDVRVIQMKHLQEWYDGLPGELSGKYKKNMADCLRHFFRWLIRWGDLQKEPVMPEMDSAESAPRSALDIDIQLDQLELIPEPHRAFIEYLMETGMRPADGCALQIRDYNPNSRKILVQRTYSAGELIPTTKGKNKDWRVLSDRARELIVQAIGNDLDPDRFIFINPVTGRGYRTEFTRKLWRGHATVSEDLYASTRHSLATQLAEDGADKKSLMDILGHRDGRSTERYTHPSDDHKRRLLNRRRKVIPIEEKKKS